MDEIFQDSKQFNLSHDSRFSVEERKNVFFGRCYMVCPLKKMPKKVGLTIYFLKLRNIKGLGSCFYEVVIEKNKLYSFLTK